MTWLKPTGYVNLLPAPDHAAGDPRSGTKSIPRSERGNQAKLFPTGGPKLQNPGTPLKEPKTENTMAHKPKNEIEGGTNYAQ
jgi:hypothetical protein